MESTRAGQSDEALSQASGDGGPDNYDLLVAALVERRARLQELLHLVRLDVYSTLELPARSRARDGNVRSMGTA